MAGNVANPETHSGEFVRAGGIRPPPRRRSRLALTLSEREDISRGIAAGLSLRAIASQLARSPSTISRELSRNGGLFIQARGALSIASRRSTYMMARTGH